MRELTEQEVDLVGGGLRNNSGGGLGNNSGYDTAFWTGIALAGFALTIGGPVGIPALAFSAAGAVVVAMEISESRKQSK